MHGRLSRRLGRVGQDRDMRLNPGISIACADEVLRQASIKWSNARSAMNLKEAYHNVVRDTYPSLKQILVAPSIAAGLHSSAYWNLLLAPNTPPANMAIATEIENQMEALEHAQAELEDLKQLAARPGLPIVYDTNMLNHWRQPGDVLWREVLKAQGEDGAMVRLVVPLRVVDELDRQKYGQGDLARRAATAIRYLERVLKDSQPGEPVKVRRGATLELAFLGWFCAGEVDHRDQVAVAGWRVHAGAD
jgi:hypothetical protein